MQTANQMLGVNVLGSPKSQARKDSEKWHQAKHRVGPSVRQLPQELLDDIGRKIQETAQLSDYPLAYGGWQRAMGTAVT